MSVDAIVWPQKSREMQGVKFDSAAWNEFAFRDDDITIVTYEKAGTTWMQQIVAQLVFQGAENVDVQAISPWLDLRLPPLPAKLALLEAQQHRRFIKTHLPIEAMRYEPRAKYIYVGRDGRDVAWSLYNHLINYTDEYIAQLNALPEWHGPKLRKPSGSVRDFFLTWMAQDGDPIGPFWPHVRGWWLARDLPNLLLVHYATLKSDLAGEISRIAQFLGISADAETLSRIEQHCTFNYMKANAEKFAPRGGQQFEGGAQSFIYKGTNGRWGDILTRSEIASYEATARRELGEACAEWLATGKL
ncbi:MAG TPA: sulfotransferase domain-containing protein [Acidobacteriaceae bacterium]|nr:sulfotransferase domain-containing protein [Acidobacteriaceae bacterium]